LGPSVLTPAILAVGLGLAGCFSEVSNNPVPDPVCGFDCPDAGVGEPDAMPLPAPPWTNGASTLAGSSEHGMVDGDRDVARFNNPVTLDVGADGRLYVADFDNDRLRAVTATGDVTTVVAQQTFERPFAVAVASPSLVYVQTDDNDVNEHSLETGTIWRVDPTKTGEAVVVARNLGRPRGMDILPDGRLILSDNEHHVLKVLEPGTGVATIIAGGLDIPGHNDAAGTGARFRQPYGVAVRADGKIIVADYGNNVIRMAEVNGALHTITGTLEPGYVDGPIEQARFSAPQDVAVSADGSIFVADSNNYVIRKISPDGMVTTVAGDGTPGYKDHDDPLQAQFYGLEGLDVSPDGKTLYVADGTRGEPLEYHRVRIVKLP
jgi:DNA-binding beta-propeller fold protein YncE